MLLPMPDTSAYAILFEPVRIGPVTAPNRFYQVPHCSGMGHLRPRSDAAMRGIKAQGGWGVVCNQETEIHPSSDLSPFSESRLWDARDIPALRLMTDAVHAHGSLAGVELAHNGNHAQNLQSRHPAMAPADMSLSIPYPRQARAMDKADIRTLRHWHRRAALHARDAGFDIIYVYAGHHMTLAHHFILPQMNTRMDEYGGSLENRLRLTRELLEDTHEAVGDTCAVALRFAVDDMVGADGMQAAEEGRAVIELLKDLPDLWDVNVAGWDNDSQTTRFEPDDGYQIPYIDFVKKITSKPVVGTGRLTSPDMMARLVRNGTLDFIGAARPSIADPFLPLKIARGRIDKIRECIGCNICVSCDNLCVPIRCTQNPTMGEEWRRGWHPEEIAPKGNQDAALVVGSGPSGLECSLQLARRGYHVTLAEGADHYGGRTKGESGLTGLGAWNRVTEYRLGELRQRANVEMFTGSQLSARDVTDLGIPNVFVATGAPWRRDGQGRSAPHGLRMSGQMRILTPDDIMAGQVPPPGPVLIYDDDEGYLAGVLAEHLAQTSDRVVFATPAAIVSPFTVHTLEQSRIQRRLINRNVVILPNKALIAIEDDRCALRCTYSGQRQTMICSSVVLVTERARDTTLYDALVATGHPFNHLELIGDAASPGLIADAVWSGHKAARDFERAPEAIEQDWLAREMPEI